MTCSAGPTSGTGFRQYLAGLLLPAERNKTLTALANVEPVVGAQRPAAQRLQWFLSESTWDAAAVTARRLELLRADPATAPHAGGVLIIDETGDRKDGRPRRRMWGGSIWATGARRSRGWSRWAASGPTRACTIHSPSSHTPRRPGSPRGKPTPPSAPSPRSRWHWWTSPAHDWPFGAVVADSFYGEHAGFTRGLTQRGRALCRGAETLSRLVGTSGRHRRGLAGGGAGRLGEPQQPGAWHAVTRQYRDGHRRPGGRWKVWPAPMVPTGPPPGRRHHRSGHVAGGATWYLATTLPLGAADVVEIVRLYGLRNWVEQQDKHVKHRLGWSQYQVRSDVAIRRHWALVQCAFAFCWWAESPGPAAQEPTTTGTTREERGEKGADRERLPGPDRRAVGRWRCGRCAPGWNRLSSCGAAGRRGATTRPHRPSKPCSTGSSPATRSRSMIPHDTVNKVP